MARTAALHCTAALVHGWRSSSCIDRTRMGTPAGWVFFRGFKQQLGLLIKGQHVSSCVFRAQLPQRRVVGGERHAPAAALQWG